MVHDLSDAGGAGQGRRAEIAQEDDGATRPVLGRQRLAEEPQRRVVVAADAPEYIA
ncbi:hypothetical protein [Streptomyces sp. NPDC048277]|uniref:hypothetical protein n=1 Tax=Streptomyces sp. NPDC048277 TaxID=3155027 RepID=UPI003402D011